MNKTHYQIFLATILAATWVIAAIHPPDRTGWLLENIVVFAFVPITITIGRYFRISNISWTCITLFMLLHIAGSHWTYAYVPWGEQIGHFLGTTRNMFDRVVHFSFGLFFAYPIREVFIRITKAKGVWAYYFPFDVVVSLSALYEIFEWITASLVDGSRAVSFMGSQGDFWDTQKDMACAAVGAIVTMIVVYSIRRSRKSGIREIVA